MVFLIVYNNLKVVYHLLKGSFPFSLDRKTINLPSCESFLILFIWFLIIILPYISYTSPRYKLYIDIIKEV
jgi:hypothetical protein